MKDKINSYIAVLLITIAGAITAVIIVRVAYDDMLATVFIGSEAEYLSLKQSILNQ